MSTPTSHRRHPDPVALRQVRAAHPFDPTTPQPVLATVALPDLLDEHEDLAEELPPVEGQPMCDHMGWLRVRRGPFPLWRKRWVAVQGSCLLVFAAGSGPEGRAEANDVPQLVIDLRDEIQLRVHGKAINVGENRHLNLPKTTRFSLTGESLPLRNHEIQFDAEDLEDLSRWCLAIRRAANGRCQWCLAQAAFSPRHKLCFECARDSLFIGHHPHVPHHHHQGAQADLLTAARQLLRSPISRRRIQPSVTPSELSTVSSSIPSTSSADNVDSGRVGIFTLRHPPGSCPICHQEFGLGNFITAFDHCNHMFHSACLTQAGAHPNQHAACPICADA